MKIKRLHDEVLENQWHAVYYGKDLTEDPVSIIVLGERVVLFRTGEGVHAFKDLCIHRGAALSLGKVKNNCIVCPYHGWEYDQTGACVKLPSQRKAEQIPKRAKAIAFHCEERYGIIWVCIGEPSAPLHSIEQFSSPEYRVVSCGPYKVEAAWTRVLENFLDFTHLMFVHEGILGDQDHAEMPNFKVFKEDGRIFTEEVSIYQPVPNRGNESEESRLYSYVREVFTPLTGMVSKRDDMTGNNIYLMLHTLPVGEHETLAYLLVSRNYSFDVDDQEFQNFQDYVFFQDLPVIESQKPEEIPLDLQEELNHKSDVLSIAYRRWLKELGVKVGMA